MGAGGATIIINNDRILRVPAGDSFPVSLLRASLARITCSSCG